MALSSSKVQSGVEIASTHINDLVDDIRTNHDHSAGLGGLVDHKDLCDSAAISGLHHSHLDIETHIRGSDPNLANSPGYDKGVHGLNENAHVAGVLGSQRLVQVGMGKIGQECIFPVTFSTILSIKVTVLGGKGGRNYPCEVYIKTYSANAFTACESSSSFEGSTFFYVAVGTK